MSETRRIMVVEDDFDMREVLVDLLTGSGFEVRAVEDGVAALRLLRTLPLPDLIMLDLMMPGMNGWQLLAELRRDPAWAAIPSVVLSAVTPRYMPIAGATVALEKPVTATVLLGTIDALTHAPADRRSASGE